MRRVILVFCLLGGIGAALADDITTLQGKTYKNLKVIKKDSIALTILCADGGATIQVPDLPPDIQKKYGYDPLKALQDYKEAQIREQEAAKASLTQKLINDNAVVVHCTVIKVLPEGAMVSAFQKGTQEIQTSRHVDEGENTVGDNINPHMHYAKEWTSTDIQKVDRFFGTVLLELDTNSVSKGSSWSGKMWPTGTYSYQREDGTIIIISKIHALAG